MSKIITFIFVSTTIVLILSAIGALHLSPQQMYSARRLLGNPALTLDQRSSIQNLLFVSHEKWAFKKAIEFKQLHRYKCRDISIDELALSAKIGLLKSSKTYNGSTKFVHFSEIYIKSELLRTITIRLSITSCISPNNRMKSANKNESNQNMKTTQKQVYSFAPLSEKIASTSSYTQPLIKRQEVEFYDRIWVYIDSLDAFTKRVVWLKYNREFKMQLSNNRIAELMCCSEETVRKTIVQFLLGLRQQ